MLPFFVIFCIDGGQELDLARTNEHLQSIRTFFVSRHPPPLFNMRATLRLLFFFVGIDGGWGGGFFVAQVLQVPHIVSHQLHPARRSVSRVRSALRGSPRGEAMRRVFEITQKLNFENFKKFGIFGLFFFLLESLEFRILGGEENDNDTTTLCCKQAVLLLLHGLSLRGPSTWTEYS